MSAAVSIGIDVGGTSTRTVRFEQAAAVTTRTTDTPQGAPALLDHLVAEIDAIADGTTLDHVGIGVPGCVTPDGEVSMALNVGIDRPVSLARQLEQRVGVPVVVENDVNAAALGAFEHLTHGSSLVYLSIGTGFAAGIVIDGQIVRGSTGIAGEIGHVALPGSTATCACGQTGCIEATVSGRVITQAAVELGLGPSAVALWDAADRGHDGASTVRAATTQALAWTAKLMVLTLDIDHVVFGGGVSGLGDRLLDPVDAQLAQWESASPLLAAVGTSRRICLAPGGVELGALGADLSARARSGAKLVR